MPGKYDSNNPSATFISSWMAYRQGVTAADDPAHPENVTPKFVLDLSGSFHGTDSQIWVYLKRNSGSGTADITLYLKSNGDLVNAAGYISAATTPTVATGTTTKYTGLAAGLYVIELTNVASPSNWDVYVCSNYGLMGQATGAVDGTKIAKPPIVTPIDTPPASDSKAKTPVITH